MRSTGIVSFDCPQPGFMSSLVPPNPVLGVSPRGNLHFLSAMTLGLTTDGDVVIHLKEMDAKDGDQRFCIICRENFTLGVLTVCGHQFVSSFWIQSLPRQEQVTCYFPPISQRLDGMQVLRQAMASLWPAPRVIHVELILWFFDG